MTGQGRLIGSLGMSGLVGALFGMMLSVMAAGSSPVSAADEAAAFLDKAARDLLAASRTGSAGNFAGVIHRYGDTGYIGSYALGDYRKQLRPDDRPGYLAGMVRFIGRYAASEAPKFPVAGYKITGSTASSQGTLVDSVITLRDGSSYDVRWLVVRQGGTYRIRDAMVYGFWMLPFMRQLFEKYIAENGGNVKSLVMALNK